MKKKLKKCSCGSISFWVIEKLFWYGEIDKDGVVDCKNKGCDIELIECKECGKKWKEENFKEFNFN